MRSTLAASQTMEGCNWVESFQINVAKYVMIRGRFYTVIKARYLRHY